MGTLSIYVQNGVLYHNSPYQFIDDQSVVIPRLSGGRVTNEMPWANVPPNIQDSLLAIDAWRYGLALAQEGMQDV